MIPGEYFIENDFIPLNEGREILKMKVSNTGDRPVQIGSHFHFFEVNKWLDFKRKKAFGMRLNIPSGTAVRFEPGEEREIELVPIGGEMKIFGLNGLTGGSISNEEALKRSIEEMKNLHFKGVD